MDNTNSNLNYGYTSEEVYDNSISLIDWIRSISWPIWLLLFIILAFLGFNIFTFISNGAEDIGSFLNTVIDKIKQSGHFMDTVKNTIFVSATGAEAIVDSTAKLSDDILNEIQETTDIHMGSNGTKSNTPTTMNNNTPTVSNQVSNQVASTTNPSTPINTSTSSTNNLQVSSNSLNNSIQQGGTNNNTNYDYQADDSSSSIQNRVTKGGWCFIGEDRGFRSCAEVSSSDYCMSGDIFPTNEVCINPSLRA